MQGIYLIKNLTSGKCYYGSSIDILRRFRTHKYFLRANKHQNIHLQRLWNKYGELDFEFTIVEEVVDKDLLQIREQFYLDNNPSGLNLCKIAGNKSGFKHSEETKLKISKSNRGKVRSQEQKDYLSKINKGKKISQETKSKISKALNGKKRNYSDEIIKAMTDRLRPYMVGQPKGFKHSQESKDKMSSIRKGAKHSEETKLKIALSLNKKINQYDKNMNFIKTWDSVKEAGSALNIRPCFISSVLSGTKKSAKGFKFKYYE